MTDKALIVAILVPTFGAKREKRTEWEGAIGTGCAVRNNFILTARHVVRPDRRDAAFPIKILWCRGSNGGSESTWVDLQPDEVAIRWEGDDDTDAALLECPRHPTLKDLPDYQIPSYRPKGNSEWESRGFPAASFIDGETYAGDFVGKVMSMARGDTMFSLSSQVKTNKQKDWRGASGMPVIVDKAIIGLVSAVPGNYDNSVLQAVPSSRLRANAEFCRLLGYSSAPDTLLMAHRWVIRILESSDVATRHLAAELAPACGDLNPCREAIADKAFNLPLRELVDRALKVQATLRRIAPADADVITRFVQAVLPIGPDSREVEKVRTPAADADCNLVRLDAHSPTLAEIIMAAADGRETRFRPLLDRKQHPRGEGCLPLPPEGGRDPDRKQNERDLATELLVQLNESQGTKLEDLFLGQLKCVLPEDWQNPAQDLTESERREFDEGLVEKIREELRCLALGKTDGDGGFTYYFVDEASSKLTMTQREQRKAALEKLKAKFPEIVFLSMAARPAKPWEELDPYGNLRALLYIGS